MTNSKASIVVRLKIGNLYKIICPLVLFEHPWTEPVALDENDEVVLTMERGDNFIVLDECATPNTEIMNYKVFCRNNVGWITIDVERKDRDYNLYFEEIIIT